MQHAIGAALIAETHRPGALQAPRGIHPIRKRQNGEVHRAGAGPVGRRPWRGRSPLWQEVPRVGFEPTLDGV